jgi:hypothetical protein
LPAISEPCDKIMRGERDINRERSLATRQHAD